MKTKALKSLLFSVILIFCSSIAEASLTANAVSSSQINLTWQINFNNEAGFHILRYNPSTSWQLINIAGANTTSYSDTGLSPNTVYVYAVRAFNAVGYSDWSISSPVVTLPDGDAPSAPQNLTGNAVSSSQINLTWQDNSNNEDGFHILRYNTSTSWQLINIAEANTTSFADTGLSPNTEYVYAMRAFNSSGPSVWVISSQVATQSEGDTTAPSVPQSLSAVADTCSQSSLSWSASTDTGGSGLKGYNLYRGGSYIKQVSAPATSTIDSGLSGETTYSYTVRAVDNADNPSGISNTAVTNTPSCQECGNSIVETPEECDDGNSTPGDGCENDCTFTPGASGGQTIWAERFGGLNIDTGYNVETDSNGNIILTGTFQGTVDFGSGSVTSQSTDMFVAKYTPAGDNLWTKQAGGSVMPKEIDVDLNGNVLVTGYLSGTTDFGGGSLSGYSSTDDIFIVKYSSTGAHQWSKAIGLNSADTGYGVAADSKGNVIVTGDFGSWVDFGGETIVGYGSHNIFVAKYSPSGAYLWAIGMDGTNGAAYGVAVDNADNIVITGYFIGTMDFGGGPVTGTGGNDIFVAKYSSSGEYLWANEFGSTGSDFGYGVAVDNSGNVVVTGSFMGTVNFGGGPLTAALGSDVFVAKYSSSGSYLWAKKGGSTLVGNGYAIAVDNSGNVAVTGSFSGDLNFDGNPISSAGGYDIFVAKYAPSGSLLWSGGFGGTLTDYGYSVAFDNAGNTIATGYFYGTVDFGGEAPLSNAGVYDMFLLKLAP